MLKLMETNIPQNYCSGLYNEKGYDLAQEHTDKILDITINGVTSCLADIKSTEYPVAFVFEENNGEFIAGAVVQYFKNEDDASKPGNWSYVWTFCKEDVPSNARIIKASDNEIAPYFRGCGQSKYGIGFRDVSGINELTRYILKMISKWLDDNASDVEEVGVILDGVIQARVAVEDGEKVKSIEPIGEIKVLIKDDAAIEV